MSASRRLNTQVILRNKGQLYLLKGENEAQA